MSYHPKSKPPEGLGDGLGEGLGDGEGLDEGLGEGEALGEGEGEGLTDGDGEGAVEALGEGEGDAEGAACKEEICPTLSPHHNLPLGRLPIQPCGVFKEAQYTPGEIVYLERSTCPQAFHCEPE